MIFPFCADRIARLSPTFATKHLSSLADYRTDLEFLPIISTIIAHDPEVSTIPT